MNVVTLTSVASTKRLERRYIEHVAREVGRIVREDFGDNQTRAAKALGIAQPTLSNLIKGESRGPGLNVLLRLRDYTDRSIDSLLGLPPVKSEELVERLRMTVETEIAREKANARKLIEEAKVALARKETGQRRQAKKEAG